MIGVRPEMLDPQRAEAARHVAETVRAGHPAPADMLLNDWSDRGDPDHMILREMADIWDDAGHLADMPGYGALLGSPTWRERIVAARARLSRLAGLARLSGAWPGPGIYAAGLAAAVVLVAIASVFLLRDDRQIFRADDGARELALADGSVVRLAARGALEVRFTSAKRLVRLQTGSASFDVSHDAARPFFVVAGDTRVRVVGTRFDVGYRSGCTRIRVDRGIVAVTPPTGAGRTLIAGEETMSADPAAPPGACLDGSERDPGRFSYRDAPLSVIVADANRFHSGRISIGSASLADERLTTSFSVGQIDQMLDSLPALLTVRVLRRPDGSVELQAAEARPAQMALKG